MESGSKELVSPKLGLMMATGGLGLVLVGGVWSGFETEACPL